jgi:hypothetical protein
MQQGQYQEYLSATLRIFEEGLSKGVVKGFAEITRTQNMLATIGETWKGEAGLERRQGIDSAISGASNLENEHDVLLWRAAQSVIEKNGGNATRSNISKFLDQGIDGPDGDKFLREIGSMITEISDGDTDTAILQTKGIFNLNETAAEEFFNAITGNNPNFSKARDVLKDPESLNVNTTEEQLLSSTQEIVRAIANIGSNVLPLKESTVSGLSKIINLMAGDRTFAASSVKTMDIMTEIGVTGDRARKAGTAFEKAYTAKNQPDSDGNGLGDYGENAKKIQEAMAALPEKVKYFTALYPNNLINQNLDRLNGAEDFTGENTRRTLSGIGLVGEAVEKRSEEDLKKEYFTKIAGMIPDDPRSRDDDELRYLMREKYDILSKDKRVMTAIEAARDPKSEGGESIVKGPHYDELAGLLKTFQSIANQIPGLAGALKEANTFEVRYREEP